jgi:integrase
MDTMEMLAAWKTRRELEGCSPKTVSDGVYWLVRFLLATGAQWDTVTPSVAVGFVASLPPRSQQRARSNLVTAWPEMAAVLPFHKLPDRAVSAFSTYELEALLAACWHPHVRAAFTFLYATGARVSEACGVNVADATGTAVVLRGKGKAGERTVPLSPRGLEAVEVLKLRSYSYLGLPTLLGVGPDAVRKWCRRLETAVPVSVSPHKFRRTFACHLLWAGADIVTVKDLMGHSSVETTMRYLATTDQRLRDAVNLL